MVQDVYVIASSQTIVTRPRRENDPWDQDDTSTSWNLVGISTDKEKFGYKERVSVNFDIDPREHYYLLYAVYSTGNSFGNAIGYHFEAIDLYKCPKKAREALKIIEDNEDCVISNQKKTLELLTEDGKVHEYTIPWQGYFEGLDYVKVEMVYVQ